MKSSCHVRRLLALFTILGSIAGGTHPVHAAVYQWCVPVTGVVSSETNDHPKAFLWIPAGCKQVRAVVVGQHNMLEEGILEDPAFRKTLTDLGFAEVWVTPSFDMVFHFDKGAGDTFDQMMTDLAHESGYSELQYAPIVPIGHSAAASYPWNFGGWNPGRTLAMLSVHGDAPLTNLTGSGQKNPDWGSQTIDGVPGLMMMGEYEWGDARLTPALNYVAAHPGAPVSVVCDAGNSHFSASDELIAYLGLFLRKAAKYRLPAVSPLDGPVALNPVDPTQGWLVDRWRFQSPPTSAPAPYAKYTGDRSQAFWCFDREMADATEAYYARQRGKLPQLVSIAQDGKTIPYVDGFYGVTVPFEPLADGISFHLSGTFLDTVPKGGPEHWSGLPAGSAIGHASGGGPVTINRICGPVAQTGPNTYSIRFYRMGMNNNRRTNVIWFLVRQRGDAQYKEIEEQAAMNIPYPNTQGTVQQITFPSIADQKVGIKTLTLNATSDAGVPVYYYVESGPADITGINTLRFSPIPPRSKFPVKVTVVAWQYGRTFAPLLQSAQPVSQTFYIDK